MRCDPAILELGAGVYELRVRQVCPEGIAAASRPATEFGSGIDQRLVAVNLRIVAAGEYTGPPGVVRLIMRIDDRANGPQQPRAEGRYDGACVNWIGRRIDNNGSVLALEKDHVACGIADRNEHSLRYLDY